VHKLARFLIAVDSELKVKVDVTDTTVVYAPQLHYRHDVVYTTVVYVKDTTVVPAYYAHDRRVYSTNPV